MLFLFVVLDVGAVLVFVGGCWFRVVGSALIVARCLLLCLSCVVWLIWLFYVVCVLLVGC